MKKKLLPIFLCILTLPCFAEYIVEGGSSAPLLAVNENLTLVYFLNGLSGAKITYTFTDNVTHKWYKYKEGTATQKLISEHTGTTSTITNIEDGYGYYVENFADASNRYIWIIDYSRYVPVFNSLTVDESDSRCEMIKLLININAPQLRYYTPAGSYPQIPRNYKLEYQTMEWNNASKMFMSSLIKDEKLLTPNGISEYFVDPPPLQNTKFTFSGDQFAEHFNIGKMMESEEYRAVAVSAKMLVDTLFTTSENEMTGLGGSFSAPASFTFTVFANEPVASFYNWKVYKNRTKLVSQSTNKILHFTFEEAGEYSVKLEVSDYQSVCTYSDSISISISDFMLWAPNAFSPTSSSGVNDVFKVAYKSVIKFNGWIFNRWGNELFHWKDPSQGWDGKYRGKYVPPGTYFYVIEATDANGKKHIRKGNVNIVGGK